MKWYEFSDFPFGPQFTQLALDLKREMRRQGEPDRFAIHVSLADIPQEMSLGWLVTWNNVNEVQGQADRSLQCSMSIREWKKDGEKVNSVLAANSLETHDGRLIVAWELAKFLAKI